MEDMCPLCGRKTTTGVWETEIPIDPIEIENQIENLDRVLEDLRDGRTSILYYSEDREIMCPMCQFLTEGMEEEKDREEFEERINKKIEELQERFKEQIAGEI